MDKVNISVAIMPMAEEFGWSATTSGLVQSSFFWGYLLTQLPGGWMADKIGGGLVLATGVFWWSLFTAVLPVAARSSFALLLASRFFVGLGEGFAPPAVANLIANWVPVRERSRATSFIFSGMNLGSVAGLVLAPIVILRYQWPTVFYLFGALGGVWMGAYVLWAARNKGQRKAHEARAVQPAPEGGATANGAVTRPASVLEATGAIKNGHNGNGHYNGNGASASAASVPAAGAPVVPSTVPWKAFFKSPAVWAMITAHFCGNWGYYILLSWMPTYLHDQLGLDLAKSSMMSVLPYMTMSISGTLSGTIADALVSRGLSLTTVRKLMQSIATIGPAVCLFALTLSTTPTAALACLTAALACTAFALSGLYCNHQDVGPRYAGVLLGITNTFGAMPGIIGVALTGVILDVFHSWNLVFYTAIFFYLVSAVVWNRYATAEKIFH